MRETQLPFGLPRALPASSRQLRVRNLLVGAVVGAILMLLALPASRPYYLGLVVPSPLDSALASTAELARGKKLPDTGSLNGQAMWFHLAAARILAGKSVSDDEKATVELMMSRGSITEPQNAFWDQADAALLAQLGRTDQAAAAWLRASKKLTWDDHQTQFLGSVLAGRKNVPAYAYAELCELRTDNATHLILQSGKKLLLAVWDQPDLGLRMRLATVLNGNLIRQHARSIASMYRGTEIIESPVTKPTDDLEASRQGPKKLLIARTLLWKSIADAKLGYDRDSIEQFFNEADAANALTPTVQDAPRNMKAEAAEAAILRTAPGAALLCSLLGVGLLGLRLVLVKLFGDDPAQSWPRTIGIAILATTIALFLTSAFAAFALGLCVIFSGTTPAHVRKRRQGYLGPLFNSMTSFVAFALVLAGAGGLILAAVPSQVLRVPSEWLPPAFNGQAAVCGVAALAIGFLFLCAPLWAFAQRLPTNYILGLGLKQLGQKLVLGSLILAVISGPTCVYLDRLLVEHRLKDQFESEPNSYLLPNIKPIDTPHQ